MQATVESQGEQGKPVPDRRHFCLLKHHDIQIDSPNTRWGLQPENVTVKIRALHRLKFDNLANFHKNFPRKSPTTSKMDIFVCPRDWTFATGRFTPDHMVSLQDPGADVSDLRPPWVPPENHYIGYFYDIDSLNHSGAPTEQDVQSVIDWLRPRCDFSSQARFIIHCDAGLGRSTATAYIAWSIFFGAGRERDAFEALKESCLNLKIIPNSIIVSHADRILQRQGAFKKPLTEWNERTTWRRTFR